jgi:hypothetical protein
MPYACLSAIDEEDHATIISSFSHKKVLQKLQATINSIIAHDTTHAMRALTTRTGNVTLVMRPPYVH